MICSHGLSVVFIIVTLKLLYLENRETMTKVDELLARSCVFAAAVCSGRIYENVSTHLNKQIESTLIRLIRSRSSNHVVCEWLVCLLVNKDV